MVNRRGGATWIIHASWLKSVQQKRQSVTQKRLMLTGKNVPH